MLNLATLLQIQTTIGLEWLIGTAAILTTGILTSWIDMKMKMAQKWTDRSK